MRCVLSRVLPHCRTPCMLMTLRRASEQGYGAAVYATGATALIANSDMTNNDASLQGGAVYIASSSEIQIAYTSITSGSAPYGAGIWSDSSTVNLFATEVSNNTAVRPSHPPMHLVSSQAVSSVGLWVLGSDN